MEKRSRDSRTIRKEVYFSEDEWEMVLTKMGQLGTNNYNAYARKMSIDGLVIHNDYSEIRSLLGELGKIGSNVNQIAKRANEVGGANKSEVVEVLAALRKIEFMVNNKVGKLIRMKG